MDILPGAQRPAAAAPSGFCPYCGRRADDAECPHRAVEPVVRVVAAPRRRRPVVDPALLLRVAAGAVLLATLAVAVQLRGDVGDLRADNAALQAQQAAAQERIAALTRKQEASSGELVRLDQQQRELTQAAQAASRRAPEAVAERALKSVYTVETSSGTGSSFVWRRVRGTALLITNAHVVSDLATGDQLTLHQGTKRWTGTVRERNSAADVAVIEAPVPGEPLAPAEPPKQGSTVLALGAPFGLDGTVTTGVLSAVRENVLQFSAEISPGSSGGAVVDLDGRVIGVAQAKLVGGGAEGLGIAIPVRRICGALRTACEG